MRLISFGKKIAIDVLRIFTAVKPSRVFFSSFSGLGYSDNPKYISETLHKLSPETEIIWAFRNPKEQGKNIPSYVKCVDARNSIAILSAYFSSTVIVNNNRLPLFKKKKGQFIIQTWHGDRAFKKVLYDDNGIAPAESTTGFCDLAIAGSEYGRRQYRSAFRYEGKVFMQGTPRNDILVCADIKKAEQIKAVLNIPFRKKILLYAPTLRNDNMINKTAQNTTINVERTLKSLEMLTGEEWVCLMRAHPTVGDLTGVTYGNSIINASHYEDMSELLLISDMLITDYSSCAGDFALLNRPIVLFQSDFDEYLEKERSFYFDISKSPYYIAYNQQELESIIRKLEPDIVQKNCKDILEFYGTTESGSASEQICEIILEWINNKR